MKIIIYSYNLNLIQLIMKKINLITFLIVNASIFSYAQSGTKWSVNGNTATSTDFIGTTNNESLILKANNTIGLKVKPNGELIFKSLDLNSNAPSGLVLTSGQGVISRLDFNTTANQVLFSNGTWGAIPTPTFSTLWNTNGSNLYYNNGYVGIGTNAPLFPLDVIGDARITNNLYVGGGVVISDKVKATTEVKGWDIKVENDLSVEAATRLKGATRIDQGFTFDGINGLAFLPATATSGPVYKLGGGTSPIVQSTCLQPNTNPWFTLNGGFISQTQNGNVNSSLTMFSAPWDGTGVIEVEGTNQFGLGDSPLLINFYCGRNTYINTGPNGGIVGMGRLVEIGFPQTDVNTNLNIKTTTGANTKAISIKNANNNEVFYIGTDGKTSIGSNYIPNGYMLAVNGKIIAEEVLIQLKPNWPDYVFNNNYKLTPLADVETYIQKNHHLLGFKKAKDYEKNGISTSEIIAKQQEKIEELTLYLIELDKKVKALEKQNQ